MPGALRLRTSRFGLVALACVLTLDAQPPQVALAQSTTVAAPVSPRNASYDIDARLDVETRRLTGTAVVTWRNVTAFQTPELHLHLYYNAWRNDRSSFLRSARRGPRPPRLSAYGPDDWAFIEVDTITLLGGPMDGASRRELATEFIQPSDGNPDDRTLLRVSLPEPVGPGETVRLEVTWTLKIPRPFQRVGVIGDYYLLGHWFPKIGVFGDDGQWRAHQFIQTEFFADFGVYDVRLTVPSGWTVGATGTRQSSTENGDATVTHRFYAEDVHDFAWTTSPRFKVFTDRFEHDGLPPVEIELLLMPDHLALKDRYFESAKAALQHFGTWFRPYAWDRITIVDPPTNSNTGGMEYPMFVTGESRWWTLPTNRLAEANTIHELAHMWWQGAVANSEFVDAWLDESFATYAHRRLLDVIYSPPILEKRYLRGLVPVAFPDVPRAQPTHGADPFDGFRSPFKLDVLATPAYRNDERTYFLLPYVKGSLMLVTLERYLGWDLWREVLATYTTRFWFKQPTPQDFFEVVNEVSGQDLTWFFDEVYRGSALFDYAVDRVTSAPIRAARGYGEGPDAVWGAGGAATPAEFESVVDIRRWGEAVFPVEIRITFDDGRVVEEQWDGRDLWTRFRYRTVAPVRTVEVDPRRVLVLDVNSTNNTWTRSPSSSDAAVKWTAKWMIWLQSVLEFAVFFA
jgi:hypothetical protein